MRCRVILEDEELALPNAADYPALRLFAEAYEDQRAGGGEMLVAQRPRQNLGCLALKRTFTAPPALSAVAEEAGVRDGLHHVCLMRAANLVVKYHGGPPTGDATVPYAGVFKPLLELDDAFARAEPPAHDDWVYDQLQGHDRTFVRQTFTRLDEALRRFAAPIAVDADGGDVRALGAASRMFADLLGPLEGLGASVGDSTPGPGGGNPRPVRLKGDPRWETVDGRELLTQLVEINTSRTVTYRADVSSAAWGSSGKEKDPPAGSRQAQVVGWIDPEGRLHDDAVMAFASAQNGEWRIASDPPEDLAVTFHVRRADRNGAAE
jgi:hypothetical protein